MVYLYDMLNLQLRPGEYLHPSLAVGEEEQVALLVPRQLVHLVFKLLLCFNLIIIMTNHYVIYFYLFQHVLG